MYGNNPTGTASSSPLRNAPEQFTPVGTLMEQALTLAREVRATSNIVANAVAGNITQADCSDPKSAESTSIIGQLHDLIHILQDADANCKRTSSNIGL